jgi:hypothetical protein
MRQRRSQASLRPASLASSCSASSWPPGLARTVMIGIVTLSLVLFVVVLAGAELVLARSVLSPALGRQAATSDYVALAWFVASLATVGGGLGAGLESHEAEREAAYAVAFEEE